MKGFETYLRAVAKVKLHLCACMLVKLNIIIIIINVKCGS